MMKFFKKIYSQIMQLDNYTNDYLEVSSHLELPYFAYTNWGMYLAELKDYKNAIDKLETAVMMHGKNPKPCISLGIIYAKLREYDKAIDILEEAIQRDSQSAYAYTIISSVYVASDKFEKAEEALKKAQKLSPNDSEIFLNYGILYAKTQKRLKALEMLEKSKKYNPDNFHAIFLLGVMYFESDKITEAFSELKYLEQVNPQYKKLNYYLALCYQKEKKYSLACIYAKKAFDEDKNNPAVYVLLAHMYLYLDEKDNLIDLFKVGEENNINDFEFFISGCIIFTKYNYIEKAKQYAQKALSIKKDDTNALYRMSVCFRKEGKIEEAIKYINKSLEADENNAYAFCDLGIIKYNEKDYETAIKLMFKSISISSEKNYLFFYIANSYYKLDRLKKAIEYYEKTLEYYPNHKEALINCTVCLMEMNNDKEALRKIRSGYQIHKESDKVVLMYALANLKCGIYTDAAEKADILLSKNSEHRGAKLIKAHALINLNKPQIALNLLNSLDEGTKRSEIFIYLSFLAYKILVEENPSHYNESMLNLFLDKMDSINSETMNKRGLLEYITGE